MAYGSGIPTNGTEKPTKPVGQARSNYGALDE